MINANDNSHTSYSVVQTVSNDAVIVKDCVDIPVGSYVNTETSSLARFGKHKT